MPAPTIVRRALAIGLLASVAAPALMAALPSVARAWCQMTTDATAVTPGDFSCMAEQPSDCDDPDVTCLAWTRRCLTYAVDGRGSATMEQSTVESVIARSFETWTRVPCDGTPNDMEVTNVGPSLCRDADYRKKKGNVNTIAFVDDWDDRDYDPSAFALTTVWHNTNTGQILDADMQLNEQLGPFTDCPDEGCPTVDGRVAVDLRNVTTHEIGHFFGLAHSERATATMYASSRRGDTNKRILDTDDVDGFCAIYPPGELPAECDPEPDNGLDLNCEDDGGKCAATPAGHADSGSGLAVAFVALLGLLVARRRR